MMIKKYFYLLNLSWLLVAMYPFYIHANAYIVDPNLIYPKKRLLIPHSHPLPTTQSTWFVDLGYGVGFNPLPRTNAPPNTPGWGSDIYRADTVANTPITSLTIGYQKVTQQRWFPSFSLGLRYSYLFSTPVDGRISLMGGRFANYYHYVYKINAQSLMLVGTLDLYQWNKVKPYLIFGIGASANTFATYYENEIVPDHGFRPEISPGYGNNTQYQLAYSVGAGLSYQLSAHWQMKVAYQWQNLGDLMSSPGKATYQNDHLSQHYSLQSVMLHVVYFF